MLVITSTQNPMIKTVAKLHQRKHRTETGQILIEGRHAIEEALTAGCDIQMIFVREDYDPATLAKEGVEVVWVSQGVMAKLATTDTPPPIVAVAKMPVQKGPSLLSNPTFRLLGLMGIQDPGNLGTLIRSACAFGIQGVVSIGPQLDLYHPKVIRASTGLVFRLPHIHYENLEGLSQAFLQTADVAVWAADAHRGTSYHTVTYGTKSLLLLGSEGQGLPDGVWQLAKAVHIPMQAHTESLNVAVAGAILMAQAYQQR